MWASGAELDRLLAEGTAPACSPELRLRAQQLTGRRGRQALAEGLLRADRGSLAGLAGAVRDGPAPRVRGLAIVSWLLCDPGSPLHTRSSPVALADVVERARAAL